MTRKTPPVINQALDLYEISLDPLFEKARTIAVDSSLGTVKKVRQGKKPGGKKHR